MVQTMYTRMFNSEIESFIALDGELVTAINTIKGETFTITDQKDGTGIITIDDEDNCTSVFFIHSYSDYLEVNESISAYDNLTDYERFRILLTVDRIVKGGQSHVG